MSLFVEIITPNQVVCSKEVASLVVQSTLGELEILPQHRPIIALLNNGSTRLKMPDGSTEIIATASGILHLENEHVILIVEEAINIHTLQLLDEIEDAKGMAQKALDAVVERGHLDQNEIDLLEAKVRAELNKSLKK